MVNDESVDGESALDLAVENKKKQMVELLIEKGELMLRDLCSANKEFQISTECLYNVVLPVLLLAKTLLGVASLIRPHSCPTI